MAGQTEVDHYDSELKRGHAEIDNMPLIELQEVEDILTELGIEKSLNKQVTLQVSRDKNRWEEFIMKLKLKMEKPVKNRASKSAITITIS